MHCHQTFLELDELTFRQGFYINNEQYHKMLSRISRTISKICSASLPIEMVDCFLMFYRFTILNVLQNHHANYVLQANKVLQDIILLISHF